MEPTKLAAPKTRPQMLRGTLLRVFRKRTNAYAKPPLHATGEGHKNFTGIITGEEDIMSLGEFASPPDGGRSWIRVLSSLGPVWVRLKDVRDISEIPPKKVRKSRKAKVITP